VTSIGDSGKKERKRKRRCQRSDTEIHKGHGDRGVEQEETEVKDLRPPVRNRARLFLRFLCLADAAKGGDGAKPA
jgi:hypothetical protein